MSKNTAIIILGFIIAVTPFLGLPGSWKTIIFVVSGLVVVLIAFLQKGGKLSNIESWLVSKKKETDVFAQNEIEDEKED